MNLEDIFKYFNFTDGEEGGEKRLVGLRQAGAAGKNVIPQTSPSDQHVKFVIRSIGLFLSSLCLNSVSLKTVRFLNICQISNVN